MLDPEMAILREGSLNLKLWVSQRKLKGDLGARFLPSMKWQREKALNQ
jgi:hypothetical protein